MMMTAALIGVVWVAVAVLTVTALSTYIGWQKRHARPWLHPRPPQEEA